MQLDNIDHPVFSNALSGFEDYIILERGCSENTLKAYSSDLNSGIFTAKRWNLIRLFSIRTI